MTLEHLMQNPARQQRIFIAMPEQFFVLSFKELTWNRKIVTENNCVVIVMTNN